MVAARSLGAVSCATGLCAATEASPAGGYPSVVTLTPRGRSTTSVAVATYQQLSQISCPSANLCVVSDTAGEVHVSTNPTVPHPAWSGVQIGTAPQCDKYNCNYDPILTVSCASEHLCVASDANDLWVSTHPAGGAASWIKSALPGKAITATSCPSDSTCVAVSAQTAYTTFDPTDRVPQWKSMPLPPITLPSPRGRVPMQISSLSCPTTHACVAVDGVASLLSAT